MLHVTILTKTEIEDTIHPGASRLIHSIANCDKFPEIRSEDCDPLRVIRSIFTSMNTFIYKFFNHHKFILYLIITLNNL